MNYSDSRSNSNTSRRTVTLRIATAFFIEHGKSNIKDRTFEFAVSFFGNKFRKLQLPLTLCHIDRVVFRLTAALRQAIEL